MLQAARQIATTTSIIGPALYDVAEHLDGATALSIYHKLEELDELVKQLAACANRAQ